MLRRTGLALAVVAAAAAAVHWSRTPVEVDVASPVRGPLVVTIDEEGQTRVIDRFVVSAPVAGRLERVHLRPGDAVAAGAVVATIHPAAATPLDARTAAQLGAALAAARDGLARAEAAAAAARAAAAYARNDAERVATLAAAGAVSQAELDAATMRRSTAEDEATAAQAAVKVAAHEVEAARAALQPSGSGSTREPIAVRAPAAGVVLRVTEEHERVVGSGTPLLELGDAANLEVVVDLLSTEAVRVAPDARVLFERWGGEGVLEGRVRRVEPSTFTKVSALGVEEQRVNVIIDFVDPTAADALGDGYALDVRIVVAEVADALKIPAGALFRDGDDWAVFVLADGRAEVRRVEIGLRSGFEVQSLAGVDAADQLILYPGDRVAPGARVVAR